MYVGREATDIDQHIGRVSIDMSDAFSTQELNKQHMVGSHEDTKKTIYILRKNFFPSSLIEGHQSMS